MGNILGKMRYIMQINKTGTYSSGTGARDLHGWDHHSFFPETERNTVRMMAQNPMSSASVKRVPRNSEERTVAEAGSRHPISVALTGPIYLTPSRNAENPPAVPISTMIAIMPHAVRSSPSGMTHALEARKRTAPPVSMPQPVTGRLL